MASASSGPEGSDRLQLGLHKHKRGIGSAKATFTRTRTSTDLGLGEVSADVAAGVVTRCRSDTTVWKRDGGSSVFDMRSNDGERSK